MAQTPLQGDLETINHAIGLERGDSPYLPEPDPDQPANEPHASHAWEPDASGAVTCSRCGMPDYWPGAIARCGKPTNGRKHVTQEAFTGAVLDRLSAFVEWWNGREDTPETLPTFNEWMAHFWEWHLANDPEAE